MKGLINYEHNDKVKTYICVGKLTLIYIQVVGFSSFDKTVGYCTGTGTI